MAEKVAKKSILPDEFSSSSEKELIAFLSESDVSLSLSELTYVQNYVKEIGRNLTDEEFTFFVQLRKDKNSQEFARFDKVNFESQIPQVAETYANYLRRVEQYKDKFGLYPCLADLSSASPFFSKQNENFNKAFSTFTLNSDTYDSKKEEGKIALSAYSCFDKNTENLTCKVINNLFESRYVPFALSFTGTAKEPDDRKGEDCASFCNKTEIPTTKFDVYDTKCKNSVCDYVASVGYAPINNVARHYPKLDDEILLITNSESKTDFIRKLTAFISDKKAVKLIVDARFTDRENFLNTLYSFVNSFEITETIQSGLLLVVRARDVEEIKAFLHNYELEVISCGKVTENGKIKQGEYFELSTSFVEGYSIRKNIDFTVEDKKPSRLCKPSSLANVYLSKGDLAGACVNVLSDFGVCSQKGLIEKFNYSSSRCVLSPLGGKYALTPSNVFAYKLPTHQGTDNTFVGSTSTFPSLYVDSPFMGALYSIVVSVAKLVASGVKRGEVVATSVCDYTSEAKAFSALLGSYCARFGLGIDCGKNLSKKENSDSFVCSAGSAVDSSKLIHNTFDKVGRVYRLSLKRDEYGVPDFEYAKRLFDLVSDNIQSGNIISASVVGEGGTIATVIKSCVGNGLGFDFDKASNSLFDNAYGDFVVMCNEILPLLDFSPEYVGSTDTDGRFDLTKDRALNNFGITQSYTAPFESVYKTTPQSRGLVNNVRFKTDKANASEEKKNKPIVLIPRFTSVYCSSLLDSFKIAGGEVRALNMNDDNSVEEFIGALDVASILVLPDGDGVEKEYCQLITKEGVFEKINTFLMEKDGLIYGEGEGFKALCSTGLITGKLKKRKDESITFNFNNIKRNVSVISSVRVASVLSPWLYGVELGEKYLVPINADYGALSFCEGVLDSLIEKGQVATQYVDVKGFATLEAPSNPTGSTFAVESLTSPCGRVYGRVGRSFVASSNLFKNREGNCDMNIIESGVKYFKQ